MSNTEQKTFSEWYAELPDMYRSETYNEIPNQSKMVMDGLIELYIIQLESAKLKAKIAATIEQYTKPS